MSKSLIYKYDAVKSLLCEADGHYHIQVPMFYGLKNYSNDKVDFIFDTEAYIIVLTR